MAPSTEVSSNAVPPSPPTSPERSRLLADYPFQAAYEVVLEDHSDGGIDSALSLYQFCIMQDLRLAWAAAMAVFGDRATTDDAWKFYVATEQAMSRYAEHEGEALNGDSK
jgi:hypothetical protein